MKKLDLSSILSRLDVLRPMLAWPLWQCMGGLALVVVLILGAYVTSFWLPLQDRIENTEGAIATQQTIYRRNLHTWHDLPRKKRQFERLKKELKLARTMLPEKSQIPDLLDGVSRAGRKAGLEFSIFQPQAEIRRELHAEVPVLLEMKGTFRQIVLFLRAVGEMKRIVDIRNLSFSRGTDGLLTVRGKALTYRLLDDGELKKKPAKTGG